MSSSDDEAEDVVEYVSDYFFEDENKEYVSFSALPLQWSSDQVWGGNGEQVFVSGKTDGGLQPVYKQVTTWKFDLSGIRWEILVLTKDHHWIKLQKPKKSFEKTIRTTLITVNCLYILKRNPETSNKFLWNQLGRNFSLLEPRPSVNDLMGNMKLIKEASKRDTSLSKSKFIATFLEEGPLKKKLIEEDGPQPSVKGFIIDDDDDDDDDDDGDDANDDANDEANDDDNADDSDEDDDDQLFDSVCAICDNGGRITPCNGDCLRSFHTTTEDANKDAEEDEIEEDLICSSLGCSKKEILDTKFTCANCIHKQHQCFSCGRLGSSDKSSGAAEVFQCVSATCGYFYHPRCVAKLLHPDDESAAKEEKDIAAGVSFTCPSHKCNVCKESEGDTVGDLQFAVCRRCPTSYHRKCLPRKISFEDTDDIEQRAWEGLLQINSRILIYCLKHKIDSDLKTPIRNHLKFPNEAYQMQKQSSAAILKKQKFESEKRSQVQETKKLKQAMPDASIGKSSHLAQEGRVNERIARRPLVPIKRKSDASSIQPVKKVKKTAGSSLGENKQSLGEQLFERCYKQSGNFSSEDESAKAVKIVSESVMFEDDLDPDSKKRIDDLFKDAESSVTLQSIYRKYNRPLSTHSRSQQVMPRSQQAFSQKPMLDNYTQGRVEGFVKAIQETLQKIGNGCDVKEIDAVCTPKVYNQIVKWKNKLRVYLAPFLYGTRYTSFGRHFTKVDKLKEIVEKIHWYVDDDDMVVDFCCGSNDFSSLMKDKLEKTGKKCSYRNFDLFQPKNDFCFEKRDWMQVKPHELPKGSKLVMGLNPPFGVNASLANKFIDKALEFKPKLIILIVPQETERLDKKKPPYDLVWEDIEELSGKSFYLPGSIDTNAKQIEDWNVTAPILFLWSRSDFTSKCRALAKKHGHISEKQSLVERNDTKVYAYESLEANAQGSDMEIDSDSEKFGHEQKREVVTEEVGATAKDLAEEAPHHKVKKENNGINFGGSTILTKKNRIRCRAKKKRLIGKDGPSSVGKSHTNSTEGPPGKAVGKNQESNKRPPNMSIRASHESNDRPPGTPYSKPHHSPGSDMVSSRSPRKSQSLERPEHSSSFNMLSSKSPGQDQLVVNKKPSSSRETGIQNRRRYHPGSSSYHEDDFPRRYGVDNENLHMRGHYSFPTGGRNPLDRSPDYLREGLSQGPYNNEMELRYRMQPPPSFGHVPPPSYGHVGMSAMDRYAPRLDDSNYPRMGNVGPPDLPMPGHSGLYGYQAPRLPYGEGPTGFAHGPRPPFSNQRSGGWLNE